MDATVLCLLGLCGLFVSLKAHHTRMMNALDSFYQCRVDTDSYRLDRDFRDSIEESDQRCGLRYESSDGSAEFQEFQDESSGRKYMAVVPLDGETSVGQYVDVILPDVSHINTTFCISFSFLEELTEKPECSDAYVEVYERRGDQEILTNTITPPHFSCVSFDYGVDNMVARYHVIDATEICLAWSALSISAHLCDANYSSDARTERTTTTPTTTTPTTPTTTTVTDPTTTINDTGTRVQLGSGSNVLSGTAVLVAVSLVLCAELIHSRTQLDITY